MDKFRELFLKRLTIDSETQDKRRKEFNQAIFDKDEGWACFNGTDLEMIMDKFDLAIEDLKKVKLEQKLIDIANAIENDSFVGEIEENSNGRGC
jgi:hypothetical protein